MFLIHCTQSCNAFSWYPAWNGIGWFPSDVQSRRHLSTIHTPLLCLVLRVFIVYAPVGKLYIRNFLKPQCLQSHISIRSSLIKYILILLVPYFDSCVAIVLAPARGDCAGTAGTMTSSNSSCDTALIVNASTQRWLAPKSMRMNQRLSVQTLIQNPASPRPTSAFLNRYGLLARIKAADCLKLLS